MWRVVNPQLNFEEYIRSGNRYQHQRYYTCDLCGRKSTGQSYIALDIYEGHKRCLENFLNCLEWAVQCFEVEALRQHYGGKSVRELSKFRRIILE